MQLSKPVLNKKERKKIPWCWNWEEVVWNLANSLLARLVPSASKLAATWLWKTTLAPDALPVTASTCIGTWGMKLEKPLQEKKSKFDKKKSVTLTQAKKHFDERLQQLHICGSNCHYTVGARGFTRLLVARENTPLVLRLLSLQGSYSFLLLSITFSKTFSSFPWP